MVLMGEGGEGRVRRVRPKISKHHTDRPTPLLPPYLLQFLTFVRVPLLLLLLLLLLGAA